MLSYRKRGPVWYVRGTHRVGQETRIVQEHSTGCRQEDAAREYGRALERELTDEILYGHRRRQKHVTFADAGILYLARPGGHAQGDIWRIEQINEIMGDYSLAEIKDGWAHFVRVRCQDLAPATVARFRDSAMAALHQACESWDMVAPRLPRIAFKNQRVRWLTIPQADRLVESYAAHVQPIARMLRLQGCRTQECLQILWPNVDLGRGTLYFERTKNGEARTVKMHHLVTRDLRKMWRARKKPDSGHVFLNRLGEPFADTRLYKFPGGNPIRSAHATAMKKAKVRPNGGADFTPHDWRHHWASHAVMNGVDLETIRRLGGWKSLDMVMRYAAVSTEHMDAAMARMR